MGGKKNRSRDEDTQSYRLPTPSLSSRDQEVQGPIRSTPPSPYTKTSVCGTEVNKVVSIPLSYVLLGPLRRSFRDRNNSTSETTYGVNTALSSVQKLIILRDQSKQMDNYVLGTEGHTVDTLTEKEEGNTPGGRPTPEDVVAASVRLETADVLVVDAVPGLALPLSPGLPLPKVSGCSSSKKPRPHSNKPFYRSCRAVPLVGVLKHRYCSPPPFNPRSDTGAGVGSDPGEIPGP